MKIDQNQQAKLARVFNKYNKQQDKRDKDAGVKQKKDRVSLSKEALQLQKVEQELTEEVDSPERQEKIDRIKAEVQAGTYNVDGEAIAEKMLDGIMNN
ncbi:flagellar biosynthesis anti-sigma factor FlgM [Natroniella sulfidigena]|uniref:flagellar biosynthesis anti-sigma factor FlgM n=1 Tax=Natroniella sulfidigena TaxID=723921 RepID=UPI002009F0D9|nr:flagellar biosynthesis anti-sigma factor FlgM [Natroniella sulfidigena]MCK8816035.1 flagellar biosynthesis anti-sigma factor FlgM [Natroniella sulfidigena]